MKISLIQLKSYHSLFGKRAIKAFIAFVLVLISTNCKKNNNNTNISQGIIQYDITYINQTEKRIPLQLMPKTLEVKFNKEFSEYTIQDRLSLFCIQNIMNYNESKHITLIKVFDKKYVYIGEPNEPAILFETSDAYKINYLKDTSRLIGFLCKKAIITYNKSAFSVYYTNSIEIEKPNKNTPYEAIDGMLLNFRLQLKSLEMELNAKKFEHKVIDNSQFDIPKEYKLISRKQMEEIITTILP
jgi:hypothetical protein